MKEYNLQSENKLIIKQGQVEEEMGDVLISWCAETLRNGQETFHRTIKKAGHQVQYSMLSFEGKVRQGDCFTTIPGFVEFNTIIHSITPTNVNLFNNSFFNIMNTLKTYTKDNVCRDAYLTIPTVEFDGFIDNFMIYEKQLSGFSFNFVLDKEEDIVKLTKLLDKKLKKSFTQKFLGKLKL